MGDGSTEENCVSNGEKAFNREVRKGYAKDAKKSPHFFFEIFA